MLAAASARSARSARSAPSVGRDAGGAGATARGGQPVHGSSAEQGFRADIQGLRAVAVGLILVYHAGIDRFPGGYIGVDVFFVISGFVITAALLRERRRSGGNSLVRFYAARARRILPAATVVVVATVVASFRYLGFLTGGQVSLDARAAALFAANFHFMQLGTDYATATAPPSPLQHFWSLAIEEQFYFVYPTLVLLVGRCARRVPFERKLSGVLVAIVVGSFAWSVVQTGANGTAAYFSPFTRVWELCVGALVAIGGPAVARCLGSRTAAVIGWLGLATVVAAAITFDATTAFPGWIAVVPVAATAAVIVAGTGAPAFGVQGLLGTAPLQWVGAISYGLYLVHWPILTIDAQRRGVEPTVGRNLVLLAWSAAAAVVLYLLVEHPIRRSQALVSRPVLSLVLVPVCIGSSLAAVHFERRANHLADAGERPPVHLTLPADRRLAPLGSASPW